ncbi:hypothetical protein N8T08_002799 [Aspergillus melleus]|uniref:Uncharacterized protein n=1 Tax=Aspergillus melleus TaxID=138277 RepID=A0ACC3B8Q4_9EURO|nr:hypothetical protein N8T08_002799 [Aspergillus melleus]
MVKAKTLWSFLSGVLEAANTEKQFPKPVVEFFKQIVIYCEFMQRQTANILNGNDLLLARSPRRIE